MSMSMPMSSMSAATSMATGMTEEVQDTAWAMRVWPVCNNITDHGPNSAQKAPSDIRKAMMSTLDSYYDMQKYSNITAAICLALVALTVAPSLLRKGRTRWPLQSRRFARLPWAGPRMVAVFRRFAYQRWHFSLGGRVKVSMAEASHMAVITAVSAGLIAWCFAIKPYYRCTREWGCESYAVLCSVSRSDDSLCFCPSAPPLGIRAGMIANALIPFLFALATKVNFVSILTSISHQRLQLYHQWAARLALFFGIVHTLPFIIQPLREGGSANLYRYWYESGGPDYWTGAVSLALMVWMIVSSTSVFRRMGYEFFVFQHLTSIVLFLIFYFMHTADTLSTWTPLWASVALWGAAYFIRWAKSAFASRFFVSMSARVEVLEPSQYLEEESISGDDMVRISLQTPLRWSP